MSSKNIPTIGDPSFEDLKQTNAHDAEYWSARDLQPLLGYAQWRRFEDAVKRAITSCEQSGNNPQNHFADAGKMVGLESGSARKVDDYQLCRFANYKEVIYLLMHVTAMSVETQRITQVMKRATR